MALAPNMVGAAALRGTWPHCLDGRDWVDAVVAPSSDTPWDDFWASLERLVNTPKLDGASFVYGAHKLDQQANRIRFQRAVAICSSDTHVCKEDLDRVLCQTEHGYLAEMLDVAMNMAWTEWYGGNEQDCTVTMPVQTPPGKKIKVWSVGVETVEQGSNIVFLQGGLSKQDWLEPICAYKDQRRGSYEDTMERKAGFDRVYGTTNNGLATFMGLPAGAPTQFFDVWQSLEPGRLLLETPAYIDGYQARIKQAAQDGSRKIDSVRFLLRSWKKAAPGTHLFDSVFISYTLKDEAAHKFALDLDAALKRKKMRCFLGERELTAGVVWEPAIRELASCSKVFVPVLSKTYLERPWCLAELHLAMNQRAEGAVSVPILIGGTGLSKSELINPQTQTAWIDRWERQALDVQQKAGVRKTPNRCADFKKLLESGLDEVWPTAGAETVAKILGKFGVLGKP